jgi:hypothetical protein
LLVKIAASSRLEGRQAHCRRILAGNSAIHVQYDCCDEKEHEGKDLGSKNVLKSVAESYFKDAPFRSWSWRPIYTSNNRD